MRDDTMQLTLAVAGGVDDDASELDRFTAPLREQLLELDVAAVKPVRVVEIPPGAKPADPVTIGALVVTLVPALLQATVALVETWTRHHPVRSVKVTVDGDSIELASPDAGEREQLLRLFLDKHARPSSDG
jgi:hypothetical protein